MIGYVFALIPLLFLFSGPISQVLYGTDRKPSNANFNLNESFIATNEPLNCPSHSYNTHIFSYEPLVIYIEGFLSDDESAHLLEISENNYAPSTITTGSETTIDTSIRQSSVALIDRTDTVRCIEHRARAFQGWNENLHIERLRTQLYGPGGHYVHHYDWSGARRGVDRVSTFMVYVDADCKGGGTEFPRLKMPMAGKDGTGVEKRWCEFLECECNVESSEERALENGNRTSEVVVFKPIKGNAVFWENINRRNGRGYEETWHAGLPVINGTKVGLNIWSWGTV
ncbi:hypothetical protein F5884DRAFT_684711 [Xylogone sp. PMI_703]|nr:hypothetical protein F5884DRAFT_684711 [Xylogone sp. PMI_703]